MTTADTISDPLGYWTEALDCVKNGRKTPPMTDGKPQEGCYRMREIKDGPWLPVYIYSDDGALECLVNGDPATHKINRVWNSCAKHPIDGQAYQDRIDTGVWPGEVAPPDAVGSVPGDNAPPAAEDPIDVLLTKRIDEAKDWIAKTPVESDEAANEAANRVAELRRLKGLVVEKHETEKKPHWDKCKEVDDRYLPLVRDNPKEPGRVVVAIRFILAKMAAWEDKKKAAAAAAAKAEQDRLAAQQAAIDKATAAARSAVAEHGAELRDSAPVPPVVPPPPQPAKASYGGITGRKISPQIRVVAVIEDQDKCYAHFRDNPLVQELLLKLSQKCVDMKMPVPGVTSREETVMR